MPTPAPTSPAASRPAGPMWQLARGELTLERVRVMAVINLTPDSFTDGGLDADPAAAVRRCEARVAEGADLLDLGAESTRPGAADVPAEEEWRRLAPVLGPALALGVPVSVDTRKAEVMRRALDAGADLINDVSALADPQALRVLAAHPRAGVCLMHMRGTPQTMAGLKDYADVMQEVADFLRARVQACAEAGIAPERVAVDPGYGFAKTPAQSFELLARQRELLALQRPLVVGLSRKGLLGAVTVRGPHERLAASVAAAVLACERGARVLRVHDVAATVDAVRVFEACRAAEPGA